jgi:predicted metal-binding membrane protein
MHGGFRSGAGILAPLTFAGVVAMSWMFLLSGAGTGMNVVSMSTVRFPPVAPPTMQGGSMMAAWSFGHAFSILVMWWIMMLAMMLPGVADKLWRSYSDDAASNGQRSLMPPVGFVVGYALPWLLFAGGATLIQYWLEIVGLFNPMTMWTTDNHLSAAILLAVGLFQLSRIKARALARCRENQTGRRPIAKGLYEAARCIANSTPLMGLLFVGGVMNLVWIVGLTVINVLERTLPQPRWISATVGATCIAGSLYLMVLHG